MELIASGRTAEVFAWDDGRVLKLDRSEWNGLASMEAAALSIVHDAGVACPCPYERVMVDGRHGVVMDRVEGPILSDVIEDATDLGALANAWTALQTSMNALAVDGLPDLVAGLVNSLRASGLPAALVEELLGLLGDIDDGRRGLCHFDLHPGNVIVSAGGWVVIDWMTAWSRPLASPKASKARSPSTSRPSRPRRDTSATRDRAMRIERGSAGQRRAAMIGAVWAGSRVT